MSQVEKKTNWSHKFLCAFRGLRIGSRGQSSFFVHLPVACFVLAAAAQFKVTTGEWCLLVLCITIVLAAEMFNSALERMAKAVDEEHHPELGRSLDVASAAVLTCAVGAAIVGAIIFLYRAGLWWGLLT